MNKEDIARKKQIEKRLKKKLTNEQYKNLIGMAEKIFNDQKQSFQDSLKKEGE